MALLSTGALKSLFTFDTHLHTNDISRCARATSYDWLTFFRLNLPWIDGSIITNHSHPPQLYDPTYMSNDFVPNNYSNIKDFTFFSGVEMNILRGGMLDISQESIDTIPWAAAAMNPLRHMYDEKGDFVTDTGHNIAKTIVNTIQQYRFDVLSDPISHVPSRHLPLIDWRGIFGLCREKGILVEVNLMINNPSWWLGFLADSKCTVCFGTDWHGFYQFRRYSVSLQENEKAVWEKVFYQGKAGYDKLSQANQQLFNSIFYSRSLNNQLHEALFSEIQRFLYAGGKESKIFNSRGLNFLTSFINTPREQRWSLLD